MPEHRIRLRGAWERLDPEAPGPRLVDLPTVWSAEEVSRPFHLRRNFGSPRLDPHRETVTLEILDAVGLVAVRLNGRPLTVLNAEPSRWTIGGDLLRRNTIEIEVGPLDTLASDDRARPWGSITLVITDR